MNITERFLKYVSFPTMSDKYSDTCPSSEKQKRLGEYLVQELKGIGLFDAAMDENGYVTASLAATPGCEGAPVIGLVAHMDTSDEASDEHIKPRIVGYLGGDITLNADRGIVMRAGDYPSLAGYVGSQLIVTDGTTLLGADDKAGIAEIVTAAERLISTGAPHGGVRICFTPDEEIGAGADHFDVAAFGADYAYTVDGGALGEMEYECFNAASGRVDFHGIAIHPGSAKGHMKNAALMAAEFISLLPAGEDPAHTEGYEGFYHLDSMEGQVEHAWVEYIIRDHDAAAFEARKRIFAAAADFINKKYGDGSAVCEISDSYRNMREIIEQHMYIVERAESAMRAEGVEPIIRPIRGGTDGARLSYMGLPCPNLCTGGENFHSRFEYIPIGSLCKTADILVRILTDAAGIVKH